MINRPSTELIRRAELRDRGFSDVEILRMCRSGRWLRLAQGVYVEQSDRTRPDAYRLRVAAVASQTPATVVSHQSAAVLHGVPLFRAPMQRVHTVRPARGGSRTSTDRQLHTALLPDEDVVELNGLQVTSVARTLFDIGRTLPFETAVAATDFALHHSLVRPSCLRAQLDRVRTGPGVGRARRVFEFADGRSESIGESRTRVLFRTFGLPRPEPQLRVFGPDGNFLGRADFGLEQYAVLCEFDGPAKYDELLAPGETARMAIAKEKRREDRFREQGWIVVRVSDTELASDERQRETCRRLSRALTLGQRTLARGQLTGSWRSLPRIGL
ncbi:MAG: type IV toxin-antitoxin system AbiEi family antitoxin domain-containing protein [Actinomycetota bacterium]|nr:type IV toxin-antitoxin system AbiEi family antitoxin domain-containing protein [Actinomycetota bacterium]